MFIFFIEKIGAPSCGLITKSDAERLCAMLFFYANLFPSQMQAKVKDPYSFYSDPDKRPSTVDDQPKLKLELKESQFILDLIKELPDEIRALVTEDQPLNRLQKIQALKTTLSFRVIHHCFGKCKGLLIPAFYQRYNSRCILVLNEFLIIFLLISIILAYRLTIKALINFY